MSTQWVNTQPDAGALHALLLSLVPRVPVIDIDELWIFPTRKIAIGESTVIVLSLYDADAERRRVMTARFTVSRDKKGVANVVDSLDEYGTAPLDAVSRVVEGVVRRLGEEIEQPPRNERIEGTVQMLNSLLLDLGAPKAELLDGSDPAGQEPDPATGPPAGAGDADDDQDPSLPGNGDEGGPVDEEAEDRADTDAEADTDADADADADAPEPETDDESLPGVAEREIAR